MLLVGTTMTATAQSAAPQSSGTAQGQPASPAAAESSSAGRHAADDNVKPLGSLDDSTENTFRTAPKHFLLDQEAIWTSPFHIRLTDATWLVPLAGFTAGFLGQDTDVSRHLSNNPNTLHRAQQLSNYGIAAMGGAGAGLYLLGLTTHDEHKRETGFLAGEAAVDGLVVAEALKYMTGRERPYLDNANGRFWKGGSSFPSEHAIAAWSIAGVIAHEYPGTWTKIAAYGMATAISASRVYGKQHFPSDVLAGSAIGWLTAQYVYKTHHDPSLRGGPWEMPAIRQDRPAHWQPKFMGSPYVPLDSWVYPVLLRLAALGYIRTEMEGMRPWTRMECARLVEEAGENLRGGESEPSGPAGLYDALSKEFLPEINLLSGGDNRTARLESLYTRVTGITGEPLRDGFDFGQTIINDYGRPYAEGFNSIVGASGWFSDGPFVGYVRGEFQQSPSSPALPESALQAIAKQQSLPTAPPALPFPAVDQINMLEGYAGMQVGNWQVTFGKQAQWWGPDEGGAMLFSNNAQPIEMFQINRTTPFTLPWFLRKIGPIRTQFFLGQIDGYHWMYTTTAGFVGSWSHTLGVQPFIEGVKVSLRPTRNLELGFSTTTLFAGQGIPFTLQKFRDVLFRFGNYGGPTGSPTHPGDSRGEFDIRYRIPGLRNWVTLYGDAFTDDEPNPLWGTNFDKSAGIGGLYLSHLPKLPKLDLRVEGVFTDTPNSNPVLQHGFFYWETTYRNGDTNDGNLIGSWIGRQGQGAQAWATYWFTPKNKLQFSYRHQKVSAEFVAGGGTVTDAGVSADLWVRSEYSVQAFVQYEKWAFPVLSPTQQSNLTTSVQLTFWPNHWGVRADAATGNRTRRVDQ